MTKGARMEYLKSIYEEYRKASKEEKGVRLREFCIATGYNFTYASYLLNNYDPKYKSTKKIGRPKKYKNKELNKPLQTIWLAVGQPCSKLLKSDIIIWLKHYENRYGKLTSEIREQMLNISAATIDRILKPIRIKYTKKGLCTTKPGSMLRDMIPIKKCVWDETRPGFMEIDTVAHCRDSVDGTYVNTVDSIDLATYWSEQRAVWGKGFYNTKEALKDIEESLPFEQLGFDSDNGSEFLNHHLYRYYTDRKKPVQFTRSRAYKKNDNAHIEQKNWTTVRQWLGYDRFDKEAVVEALNDLYKNEWRLYHNFFKTTFKLKEKKRIASKTIKKYYEPKTPYQRVLESKYVSNKDKEKLTAMYKTLDPFKLKEIMEKKIKKVHYINRKRPSNSIIIN